MRNQSNKIRDLEISDYYKSNSPKGMSYYRNFERSFRESMILLDIIPSRCLPKILLVDDDSIFCQIFKRCCDLFKVHVDTCPDPTSFVRDEHFDYDVIVMDYNLGGSTGLDLIHKMESKLASQVPVILVSGSKQALKQDWPFSIREFVHKDLGPITILDAVFEAHELKDFYEDVY